MRTGGRLPVCLMRRPLTRAQFHAEALAAVRAMFAPLGVAVDVYLLPAPPRGAGKVVQPARDVVRRHGGVFSMVGVVRRNAGQVW